LSAQWNEVAPSESRQRLGNGGYRADVDGLRAIAVLSVLIFHAFPSALRGGYIGVDIFFVISGFLISSIIIENLEAGRFSFFGFYARRVRRIFPALLLVFFSCLSLGWFFLLPDEYQLLGKHVTAGAAFLSNFVLWNESGYFDAAASQKPLLHLWSLGIEEQFYLFWPLLTWMAYRHRKRFFGLVVTIAVVSFLVNVLTVASNPVEAFYSPLSRFWELMVGSVLAYLTIYKPQNLPRYSNLSAVLGLILIGTSLLILDTGSRFPGWWALLPTLGTFLLISYPLYLWHWPTLYFGKMLSTSPSHTMRFLAVALSGVLATLTYLLVEKPIRHSASLRQTSIGLFSVMAICGLLGVFCYVSQGFPSRLPQQFAKFTGTVPKDLHSACFLINSVEFPPACTQVSRRPSVFVWGDSQADRLYWGLKPLQDLGRLGLLQVTGNSCPPLLRFKSNGNCKCQEINNFATKTIQRSRPEMVILHANWADETVDLSKLDATVQQLKADGAKNVILLGPTPRWSGTLLRSMFRCWQPKTPSEEFPLFSKCGLEPRVPLVDAKLREIAERLDIEYISAYQAMCTSDGCITHVDNGGGDELVTYDAGHLSPAGARYLIDRIHLSDRISGMIPAANGGS
jgi:peptidoglycan/LPS O-acetylase OafA/YrhL